MKHLNYPKSKTNIWFNNLVRPVVDKINSIIDSLNNVGGGIENITTINNNIVINKQGSSVNIKLNSDINDINTINATKIGTFNVFNTIHTYINPMLIMNNDNYMQIMFATDTYNTGFGSISFNKYFKRIEIDLNMVKLYVTNSDAYKHIFFSVYGNELSFNETNIRKLNEILNNYTLQNS